MQTDVKKNTAYIVLAIFCAAKLFLDVYQQFISLWTLCAWVVLIILFFFLTRTFFQTHTVSRCVSCFTKKEKIILLLLGVETLISLWWFGVQPTHFHYDEFITATTSYTLPIFQNINWFGVFPNSGEWVCQFPIFFHILQYPFVHIFPTVMGVRMSTWPYTLGTVFMIYLLTRYITKKKVLAFYAANAFLLMAPQQYIGSLGLHFHAGIFFFVVSIYAFMKTTDEQHPSDVFALGISIAFCYLGYTAAYMSAPLLIMLGTIRMLFKPEKKLFRAYVCAAVIALLTLTPWGIYAVRYNNFFLQRIDQINAVTGTWIEPQNKLTMQNITTLLPTRTLATLSSLLEDHRSGVGDYLFGSMALLDPFSIILLSVGFVYFITLAGQKNFNAFVFISSMIILFITSTVFTQSPTPFHRLSIDFPFFGICIGSGIGVLYTLWNKYSKVLTTKYYISIMLLTCFGLVNTFRAYMMVQKDIPLRNNDSLAISQDIQSHVKPGELVQIIAFSQYHLGKELFFRTNGIIRYTTNRMNDATIMPYPKFIIVHNPDDVTASFIKANYPFAARLFNSFKLKSHAEYLNN